MGYMVAIIWERELKDLASLEEKLRGFVEGMQ